MTSTISRVILSVLVVGLVAGCDSANRSELSSNASPESHGTMVKNRTFPDSLPKQAVIVPDSLAAVRLADLHFQLAFTTLYVSGRRRLIAKDMGDHWYVTGSLPPKTLGGVPEVRISKRDAAVVSLVHYR